MGSLFKIPGTIIIFVSQIIAGLLSLGIVIENLGFIIGLLAFAFMPITHIFVPIYDGLANSNWSIMMIVFGGLFTGGLLNFIGEKIDDKF